MNGDNKDGKRVIVVGAGFSGLTAGLRLKQAGFQVIVLEKAEHAGGRAFTVPFHGTHADIGAIMFFEDYRNIQGMLKEFGLHNEQAPVPGETVIHRNGAFRKFNLRKPWTLLRSGAMSMSETVSLTAQSLIAWFKNRNNALYGITDWPDKQTAAQYLKHSLMSDGLVQDFWAPLLDGFTLQKMDVGSEATLLAFLVLSAKSTKQTTMRDGIATLPRAIAQQLDIRYSTEVKKAEASDTHVSLTTADCSVFEADYVVLANPPGSGTAYTPTAIEAPVYNRPGNPTMKCLIGMNKEFRLPKTWKNTPFAIFIPESQSRLVRFVSLESGKVNRQTPNGEIFDVQLTPDAARELKSKSEAEIRTVIVEDMQHVFSQEMPTFSRSVTEFRSFYWPYGTPDTTPGWAEKVKAYYRDLPVKSRVFLAGDRLAVGATEGAAASGATAAKLVKRAYTKRNS